MAWIHLPSVTLTQGSPNVAVHNAFETTHVQIGDGLLIEGFSLKEIAGIFADKLVLKEAWPHATQTKVMAKVVPTASDFNLAAQMLREATTVTQGNFAEMEKWWTQEGTVTFRDYKGKAHTVKTAKEMEKIAQEQVDEVKRLRASMHFMGTAQHEAWLKDNEDPRSAAGFSHMGKHHKDSVSTPINTGMYVVSSEPNSVMYGHAIDGHGDSESDWPVFHCAGADGSIEGTGKYPHITNIVELPEAPKGTFSYNKKTGAWTEHMDSQPSLSDAVTAAFAAASANADIDVVTMRVDSKFIEQFDCLSDECFLRGNIHYQGTTFGKTGIPTVESSRPETYFAMYKGQKNVKKGHCVKLSALTAEQLALVAQEQSGFTWVNEKGQYAHHRRRFRTAAGLWNGDWYSTDCAEPNKYLSSTDKEQSLLMPQGDSDTVPAPSWANAYVSTVANNPIPKLGVFTAKGNVPALNGRCHIYYLGSIPRLNQGMSSNLNDFGTKKASDDKFWYNTTVSFTTLKDHFDPAKLLTNSGRIGTESGRVQDGKRYDCIAPSGRNGPIDWRMSAFEEHWQIGDARQKTTSTDFRGKQKLNFSRPVDDSLFDNDTYKIRDAGNHWYVYGSFCKDYAVGDYLSIYNPQTNEVIRGTISNATPGYLGINRNKALGSMTAVTVASGGKAYAVGCKTFNLSISYIYSEKMLIGNLPKILEIDIFKNGWFGTWCFVVPTAGQQYFPLTREPFIDGSSTRVVRTSDGGKNWQSVNLVYDPVKKNVTSSAGGVYVTVVPYSSYAKTTLPTVNSVVYQGVKGVGGVIARSRYRVEDGALFAESLLGKALTSNTGQCVSDVQLTHCQVDEFGKLTNQINSQSPTHHSIQLSAPNNDGPAIKSLAYDSVINQRLWPHYAFNELRWQITKADNLDGTQTNTGPLKQGELRKVMGGALGGLMLLVTRDSTGHNLTTFSHAKGILYDVNNVDASGSLIVWDGDGWADDHTIKIADKVSAYQNRNGHWLLCGTHRSSMPLWYIKNRPVQGNTQMSSSSTYVANYYQAVLPPTV